MILGYVVLFVLTYVLEIGLAMKMFTSFYNELFDDGYKVNNKYQEKIMKEKYKVKPNIFDLIPGLNIMHIYFSLRKNLKKLRQDPAFINNLEKVTDRDRELVEEVISKFEKNSVIKSIKRGAAIILMSDYVDVRYEGTDLGSYTKDDLKDNDGILSDYVLEKMEIIDDVFKSNEGKVTEKSFYNLSGKYSMSDVFKFDEDATFIRTHENADVAIVGANEEEIREFLSKSLIVKPRFDASYHIISLKPFDKNLVRRALVEMEYFKEPFASEIIDEQYGEEEKKRTL